MNVFLEQAELTLKAPASHVLCHPKCHVPIVAYSSISTGIQLAEDTRYLKSTIPCLLLQFSNNCYFKWFVEQLLISQLSKGLLPKSPTSALERSSVYHVWMCFMIQCLQRIRFFLLDNCVVCPKVAATMKKNLKIRLSYLNIQQRPNYYFYNVAPKHIFRH